MYHLSVYCPDYFAWFSVASFNFCPSISLMHRVIDDYCGTNLFNVSSYKLKVGRRVILCEEF